MGVSFSEKATGYHPLSARHQLGNARKNPLWEGFIHNVTSCSINIKEIRTLPELLRTDYTRLDTPAWYAPDSVPELVPEESPRKKEDLPAAVR